MHQHQYKSRKQASEYLTGRGVSVATASLAKYAVVGGGPPFRKFGRRVLYSVDALDAWLDSKLSPPRRNTSEGE
jgi:hypothetical protein